MNSNLKNECECNSKKVGHTDWSRFDRFAIPVDPEWVETLGDKYPNLVVKNDEMTKRLGIPDSWEMQVRWKNMNPFDLRRDVITLDLSAILDDILGVYHAIVWVPNQLVRKVDKFDTSKMVFESVDWMKTETGIRQIDTGCLLWEPHTSVMYWGHMFNHRTNDGEGIIGIESYTLQPIMPLITRYEKGISKMTDWMRRDAGWVKTTGPDGVWFHTKCMNNPNT